MEARTRKVLLISLIFWIGASQLVSSEQSSDVVEPKANTTSPGPTASPPVAPPFPNTTVLEAQRNNTVLTDPGSGASTNGTLPGEKGNEAPAASKDENKDDERKKDKGAETTEEEGHCCGTKVHACLSSPGDASDEVLLLLIKSREDVKGEVITPGFLRADPATFAIENGKDATVRIEMVDAETAKNQTSSTIKIQSPLESCEVPVPSKNLGYNGDKSGFNYSALRTPVVGFSMLAAALVLVLGIWAYCRYRVRKARHVETSPGARYVELEMGLGPTPVSAAEVDDNWDQGWEDDWEDSGNSQFKLTKSLSAKGLAARRTSKDGWTD